MCLPIEVLDLKFAEVRFGTSLDRKPRSWSSFDSHENHEKTRHDSVGQVLAGVLQRDKLLEEHSAPRPGAENQLFFCFLGQTTFRGEKRSFSIFQGSSETTASLATSVGKLRLLYGRKITSP